VEASAEFTFIQMLSVKYLVAVAAAVLCLSFSVEGQTFSPETGSYYEQPVEKRNLDRERWREIREELRYAPQQRAEAEEMPEGAYDPEQSYGDEKIRRKRQRQPQWNLPTLFNIPGAIVQGILIVLLIVGLSFLLYKLVAMNWKKEQQDGKTKKGAGAAAIDEENIHESDLERALREALEAKAYRQAVRVYYLMIIKTLAQKEWINWRKEKTNSDYLLEMIERPQYPTFRELTLVFEKTWYGDVPVEARDFESLRPKFHRFLQGLDTAARQNRHL